MTTSSRSATSARRSSSLPVHLHLSRQDHFPYRRDDDSQRSSALFQRGLRLRKAHGRRAEPDVQGAVRLQLHRGDPHEHSASTDNFHLEDSHVIPGLIHRGMLCKKEGKDFRKSGVPASPSSVHLLQRPCQAHDLDTSLVRRGGSYHSSVGEEDEISISDVAYAVAKALDFPKEKVKFDTSKADGQFKKTANNAKLRKYLPDFKFTPFEEAMDATVKWFMENYDVEGVVRK